MARPVYTPRINNNDDEVRLSTLFVQPGDVVAPGKELAEIETDKANFVVEAESGGHVLGIAAGVGDLIGVGSVLLWLGDLPGEAIPPVPGVNAGADASAADPERTITAKASALL